MSSREVAQTVAKKLKYYLDVKRREDGFDLSGPYLPKEDPNPLRAGPTLAYDGIHDRSLKHYFHNNTVKKQLQHMTVPSNMHRRREKSIRKFVDETMASVDYRLKAGPISPYSFPQTFQPVPPPHRPKALRTVDEYFRTRRGSRRRKLPTNIVGKARRITRRSPPQHVHKDERERIVNMASKLIVATETVALPQQKKQSKGFQASEKEFPRLERRASKSGESSTESAFTSGHESEGSVHSRTPCPPKREKPSSASHRRRPQSSFFKSSSFDNPRAASGVHVLLPNESSSDHEKIKYLMDRMNLDGRGTSVMAAPRDFNRPKSAAYPLKSTATTGVETDLPDYTDDDFCSDDETPKATARSPRVSAWSANEDMIDMCTQTVVHSGTQTKFPEFDDLQHEREVVLPKNLSWVDKADDVTSRPPVAVATTGASTSDVLTSTSHETQTRNRDLEPKVITYEVYVQTGDRLGAGSKVNVKITLFGEYGNSGERQLLRSKIHRNKFQRGQVDVFAIDSLFLGKLQNIRIGHNETRLGYGWFLDKVYIKEGVDATRSFEFRCNRWLSSRDDDGQIMRDLPLYDVVPASHVEAILPREPERDAFYSNADSDSTHSENDESPPEVEPRINESTRKKSKNKTPTTSKSKSKTVDEVDGFKGTKAEDLFEVGDDDEEEDNEDRFFDPEDEYESERSDDENLVDRKEPQRDNKVTRFKNAARATRKEKKREQESNEEEEEKEKVSHESKKNAEKPVRFSHVKTAVLASRVSQQSLNKKEDNKESSEEKERDSDEQKRNKKKLTNVATVMRAAAMKPKKQQVKAEEKKEEVDEKEESESEEEQQEEKEVQKSEESEDELEEKVSPQKVPKGAHHLRVITTALSPFLKNRQGSHPPPSPIPEEPPETPEKEPKKTTEKPREKTEDSDEDEPAVEFTNEEDEEEDKKPERPSSARSDDYDEGFRAGIRRKQEEERKRHRESITESESVLKSGQSIHDAAKAGNLPRIKELIQVVPAMKNTRNEKGMGPLHIAASNGHLDCVKWLAVSGVDLADETPTGYTAMHLAAMNGHVNCMMILAAMGSTVSCKTVDNFTPIHLAAMSGHIECVKWLLANRAQVEVEDMNGRTALDIAEEYGHEAIQKLLQKFKKELKRQDSTLAQLMTVEKRRKSVDSITSDNDVAPSKVSDSGVGGMESEEDNWISDTEEDVTEDSKQAESSANRRASTSSRDRPDSASRSRTDNIVTTEEKKKMFQEQRQKMKKRHSSFLDSIRMDVEDANQEEF